MLFRAFAALAASSLLAAPGLADTIRLLDGKSIEGVQIVSDGLKEVTYKQGRDDKSVSSDAVLAVEYEKRPPALDEAEGYIISEDYLSAVDTLDTFVQAALDKPQTVMQYKWAPAFAAWRALEVRQNVARFDDVKTDAAKLVTRFPDTRYALLALLAKARAEVHTKQGAQALKTVGEVTALVATHSLPKRWEFEARLLQAQADDKLKVESQRNEFERIAGEAQAVPVVRARALALAAETYLVEAARNQAGAKDLRSKAQAAFQQALEVSGAGRDAQAAAYCGLGESLFLQGADTSDKALLQESVLNFLRVCTLFRGDGVYSPKALFYAMRCFDLLGDGRRKFEMRRELLALYPETTWATEAKARY